MVTEVPEPGAVLLAPPLVGPYARTGQDTPGERHGVTAWRCVNRTEHDAVRLSRKGFAGGPQLTDQREAEISVTRHPQRTRDKRLVVTWKTPETGTFVLLH